LLTPAILFAQTRSIAITFDDLPYAQDDRDPLALEQQATSAMIEAVKKHHAPAVAFVNEGKVLRHPGQVDAHIALLEQWVDAGVELGNHNFGHVGLTDTPLAQVEDAVIQGEPIIRQIMERRGKKLRYYREPFEQVGATPEIKAEFEKFLAGRGYTRVPFTIEDSDWVFANALGAARGNHDAATQQRVRAAYLAYFDQMMDWFEALSRDTFGREIPQIIILHVDEVNGYELDALLTRLEKRGYKFVTVEEAMKDPAWQSADGYVGKWGPSWLHRWRKAMGKENRLKDEADPPQWVTDLAESRGRKE
jgi:peptidoglycan/xylan/chitin deacetylase (PgdA/CDA1 family)